MYEIIYKINNYINNSMSNGMNTVLMNAYSCLNLLSLSLLGQSRVCLCVLCVQLGAHRRNDARGYIHGRQTINIINI